MTAPTDIAVIGMSGRFPGAPSTDALWANLRQGIESVTFLDDAALQAAGVPQDLLDDADYVRAAYLLDGADRFDAAFFGYAPREARFIDPQQRVLLECAWNALEHAGYAGAGLAAGVYVGCSLNTYLLHTGGAAHFARDPILALMSSDKDFLATRIGYKLGLEGPCLTVQTACSTSLVALHVACQSLLAGECDVALAGGVCVKVPVGAGYLYREGGMLSKDGHCRPFDAEASGTIFGSGAAIVVLKRLDAAERDGDTIHAVVKATAINNDGARKASYTAPSVEGIAEVLRQAFDFAGMRPRDVGCVECHGTGTPLGDPIEVRALRSVWQAEDTAPDDARCALGSVKSNVGHLEAAAGITGFVKALHCVRDGVIPATLHFRSPNPALALAPPFHVADTCRPWPSDGQPRSAAVLSLGVGGTNAAVIVQQPPAVAKSPASTRRWHLLPCSAKSAAQLAALRAAVTAHVRGMAPEDAADAAFTLARGRTHFAVRNVAWYDAERGTVAEAPFAASAAPESGKPAVPRIVFAFGEAGADGALAALRAEPAGRVQLERVTAALDAADARQGRRPRDDARRRAFVGQVALARLWADWGLAPDALLCEGGAAVAAAHAGGSIDIDAAARLLAEDAVSHVGAACFEPGAAVDWHGFARQSLEPVCVSLLDRHAALRVVPLGGRGAIDALLRPLLRESQRQRLIEPMVDGDDGHPPALLKQATELWCAGAALDLGGLYRDELRRRVPLPTMPFRGERHWW